jgi:hypothetical protein
MVLMIYLFHLSLDTFSEASVVSLNPPQQPEKLPQINKEEIQIVSAEIRDAFLKKLTEANTSKDAYEILRQAGTSVDAGILTIRDYENIEDKTLITSLSARFASAQKQGAIDGESAFWS